MDLGSTQKPRVHLGGLSTKQLAFVVVAGLVVVGGIALRAGNFFGEPADVEKAPVAVDAASPEAATAPQTATVPKAPAAPEAAAAPEPPAAPVVETTPEPIAETPPATQEAATSPSEPVTPAGEAGDAAQPTEPPLPDESTILVARRPVELLAGPSPSATVMYGFPAGRPFRVIGQEGGYVQIRDEKSGASGWIDKTALAAPPPRVPVVTTRSRPKPAGAGGRSSPKPSPDTSIADELETAVEPPKRPGLFGGDGLFGGIFRN